MFIYERLKVPLTLGLVVGLLLLFTGCGSHVYHQVRPDDTLYSIGWRYGQDYRQIASWNGIAPPYVIHAGDWVRVAPPSGGAAVRTLATAESNPSPSPSPSPKPSPSAMAGERANKALPVKEQIVTVPSAPLSVPAPLPSKPSSSELAEPVLRVDVTWMWPVKGRVVARFNAHSPANQGIDIVAPLGSPVYAAAAGKVVYSGNGLKGYGNLVIIKHNDKYLSAYGHNQRILVAEGSVVGQGEVIAHVGSSEAERVQLHFQIRIDGKPVDPLRYLP